MLSAYGGGRGHPTDQDVWFRLIERLESRRANRYRGSTRPLPKPRDLREIFDSSTSPLQPEMGWRKARLGSGITLAKMRQQSRRDDWAIQRLYVLIPAHVQQAERAYPRLGMTLTQNWRRARRRDGGLDPISLRRAEPNKCCGCHAIRCDPTGAAESSPMVTLWLGRYRYPAGLCLLREYRASC